MLIALSGLVSVKLLMVPVVVTVNNHRSKYGVAGLQKPVDYVGIT